MRRDDANFVDSDDVGMIQLGNCAGLVPEALVHLRPSDTYLQDLDRSWHLQVAMLAQVYLRKSP